MPQGLKVLARCRRVGVEQGLHVAGVRRLARREAVLGAEGLGEGLGAVVAELPVPVGRAEDALHRLAGALGHQLGVERDDDLEVLAVDLLALQAELHRLGQRVDHVAAVVVEDQDVGARVQHRRQVLREVAGPERGADLGHRLPAERLGRRGDRLLLGPAPGVVGGQVVGAAVLAVLLLQHRRQRRRPTCRRRRSGGSRWPCLSLPVVSLEWVRPAMKMTPISWQRPCTATASAEDEPPVIMIAPSFSIIRLAAGAGGVGLGLGVAGDEGDLLAVDAGAGQLLGGEGGEQAAVAFAVQVLDGELVGAQLVHALVGVGAGLRHVEAEGDGVAGRGVQVVVLRPGAGGEDGRRGEPRRAERHAAAGAGGGES